MKSRRIRSRYVRGTSSKSKIVTGRFTDQRPPPLLFVTSRDKLAKNIGVTNSKDAIAAIEAAGHHVCDVQGQARPAEFVARKLANERGVVIVGGYDVVPATRLDVLDQALRRKIERLGNDDPDKFIVWSDDAYADKAGEMVPTCPVSRIPDGRHPRLISDVLSWGLGSSKLRSNGSRFGIRNCNRPFAEEVFSVLKGKTGMLVSEPITEKQTRGLYQSAGHTYIMLHGSNRDTSRFWGERLDGRALEAFNIRSISKACGSVVLAGCCWGALTVSPRAVDFGSTSRIRPIDPSQSIALTFLLAGAQAFVGCTGVHYSPSPKADHFGGPMHRAFWECISAGDPPSLALFNAKKEFVSGMPHGQKDPQNIAIELKILRQFTCLGLGW